MLQTSLRTQIGGGSCVSQYTDLPRRSSVELCSVLYWNNHHPYQYMFSYSHLGPWHLCGHHYFGWCSFYLGYHVKCIDIYLIPFECQDMPRWFTRQQVHLLIQTLVTLTSFLQLTAESFHVSTRNPGFSPPREFRSYNVLVYLDIRIHQGGVL